MTQQSNKHFISTRTYVLKENGSLQQVLDLKDLVEIIQQKVIEKIVIGYFDNSGNLVEEKQFTAVDVLPARFGQ